MIIDAQIQRAVYYDKPDIAAYEPAADMARAPHSMVTAMYRGRCNYHCKFCLWHGMHYHNAEPVTLDEVIKYIDESDAIRRTTAFLISGSECTQFTTLAPMVRAVKYEREKEIRIDTNGTNPSLLGELLEEGLLSYVAMDVKAPPSKYDLTTQRRNDMDDIERSIELIKRHAPRYKFRTTVCRELLTADDIVEIGRWLNRVPGGRVKCYEFKDVLDSKFIAGGLGQFHPLSTDEMTEAFEQLAGLPHPSGSHTLTTGELGVRDAIRNRETVGYRNITHFCATSKDVIASPLTGRMADELATANPREGLGWS